MKESKRRQSLSGAVLIMILTVMFVLIILLTATLTTVTTANQRIYTKFEENQAYYTARSALDVFTQNMMADADYISDIDYTYTKEDGSSDTIKMKQGLGLQMDLYMLKSQSGFCNVPQDKLEHFVTNTSVDELKRVEYKDWFGTDSSKVKNNGKPTTDPDYKEYVEYEVELPQLANGGSQYGKLSDLDSGVSKAKIKVEVLSRTYDIGEYDISSYSGYDDFFENASDDAKAEAVVSGVRINDKISVKITATTTFDGVEGTAVLILDSAAPSVIVSGGRALTAFGNLNLTNHAYIVGGASVVGDGTNNLIAWRNGGGEFGPVHSEVGLQFNVVSEIHMTDGEYMYVGGDLLCDNSSDIRAAVDNPSDLNSRPYIFVDGNVSVGNSGLVMGGTGDEAVDLIIKGDLNIPGNKFIFNGNVYCNGNCTIDSTGINAGDAVINGNLYVGGNLNVSGNIWQANDEGGTIKFEQNGGTIYVNSSSTITGGGASYSAAALQNGNGTALGTFTSSFTLPDKVNDVQNVTATGTSEFSIELPDGIVKTLRTHKGNYDVYYAMDGGNYVDLDSDGNVPDRIPAEGADGYAGVNFTAASFIPTDKLSDAGTDIEVSGSAKYLLANGNYNNARYYIHGGGTVELVLGIEYNPHWMPDNYNIQNIEIVVADDTTVKVYGGIRDGEYTLEGFKLWTETAYNACYSDDELYAGKYAPAGKEIKTPQISYYFSGGKVITTNGPCFLAGYFYGPNTTLEANAGNTIKFSNLYYNGQHVNPNWIYDFLGFILCDNLSMQNEHGIIFVGASAGSGAPAGEPIHKWNPAQYVRS